tara:strand:+ start:4946 stop:5635 length:690 start_codon:yes stop_codon:yes gene_type:complete
MVPEKSPISNQGSQDPYILLGIEPGSTFEVIKQAKENKILEAAQDPIKKAKIEAAYDSLLMVSLKARQLGNVSNEAANASQQEKIFNKEIGGIGSSLLTRLGGLNSKNNDATTRSLFPSLSIPAGQGLNIRIALGVLAFVLILVSPDQSIQLILSLSTIGLFISQVKRGRKLLPALGWSVVLLSVGLILGGLISNGGGLHSDNLYALTDSKIEALPALFLIFIGSILLE